jgi:hypothetical protein
LRGLEEPAHTSRGLDEPFFQLCCCVSFWFWREKGFGCTYYYVLGLPYSCGVVLFFFGKKVLVICLAGARSLLRPEKKVLVVCLVGARSLLRLEKKVSSVLRVRDYYYFYHGSDLREIIRFLNVSNLNVTNLY